MKTPPVIGLTGGIGAGKSEVARMLGELGCLVVNSDDLARQAIADPKIRQTLHDWWGDAVFNPAGEVDRSKVASIVFADPDQRRRLESLIHPWVERRRKEIFRAAAPAPRAFVIDAPLLMEAGVDRECDVVLFVDASRETRLARVRAGRGWDAAELDRREAAQLPLDRKRELADSIVNNDGDRDALFEQVRAIVETLLRNRSPEE